MMCHSESSSVSNKSNETKRISGDNRESACVCVCECAHHKSSDVLRAEFIKPIFQSRSSPSLFSEPFEIPWIIHCLNQYA